MLTSLLNLRADRWDGEYVRSGEQILGELTDNEDMFLWGAIQ